MPRTFPAGAWIVDGEEGGRVHKPRRELFTQLRVAGAPPAKGFSPTRITEGSYFDSGEKFRRVHAWTARATAHADLVSRWTGSTRFLMRAGERSSIEDKLAESRDAREATSIRVSSKRKRLLKVRISDLLASSRDAQMGLSAGEASRGPPQSSSRVDYCLPLRHLAWHP